jgi:hypothetical protein
VREIKQLGMFLDCFPVIHRHLRNYSEPFLTESFEKLTVPDLEDSDDEGIKVDNTRFKVDERKFFKQNFKKNNIEFSDI